MFLTTQKRLPRLINSRARRAHVLMSTLIEKEVPVSIPLDTAGESLDHDSDLVYRGFFIKNSVSQSSCSEVNSPDQRGHSRKSVANPSSYDPIPASDRWLNETSTTKPRKVLRETDMMSRAGRTSMRRLPVGRDGNSDGADLESPSRFSSSSSLDVPMLLFLRRAPNMTMC